MDVTGNYSSNSVSGQPSPLAPAYPRPILKGVGAAPAAVPAAAAPATAAPAAPTSAATAAAVTAPAPVAPAAAQNSVAGVLSGLTQAQQAYLGPAGPAINELLVNYAATQAAKSPQQLAIEKQNDAIRQKLLQQPDYNTGTFGSTPGGAFV